MEKNLIKSILKGRNKANPIHLSELSNNSHIDSRQVKEYVRQLRAEGEPIGGDTYVGYYWANNIHDLDDIINSIQTQINTRLQAKRALENTRLRMLMDKTQEKLW